MEKKWIQNANVKKGALHRQLGYPESRNIPTAVLQRIQQQNVGTHVRTPAGSVTVTRKMKKRVNFALNVQRPF